MASKAAKPPAAPLPPLTIDRTANVHDKATLTGTHPLTIGPRCVIHPFAIVDSTHGPVELSEGVQVWECASIGLIPNNTSGTTDGDSEAGERKVTTLGKYTIVHPRAAVSAACQVGDYVTIDVHASLGLRVVVGDYARVGTVCHIPAGETVEEGTAIVEINGRMVRRGISEMQMSMVKEGAEREAKLGEAIVKTGSKWMGLSISTSTSTSKAET